MYLISAQYKKEADIIAQKLNLNPNEYTYIPCEPNKLRFDLLAGRRALKKENLIGEFTEEETQCLLMD